MKILENNKHNINNLEISSSFEKLNGSINDHKKTLDEIAHKINERLKQLAPTQSFNLSYTDLPQKLAPILTDMVFDTRIKSSAREVIANIIGNLQDKEMVGQLIKALSHPNVDQLIHYDISKAIEKLADTSHAQALTYTLLDTRIKSSAREVIANIIGNLQDKEMIGQLNEALSHPSVNQSIHYNIRKAIEKLKQ